MVKKMNTSVIDEQDIKKLASRHIAKLLTRLHGCIAPVVEQEIKRQFRFFSEDVISVIQGESSEPEDKTEQLGI